MDHEFGLRDTHAAARPEVTELASNAFLAPLDRPHQRCGILLAVLLDHEFEGFDERQPGRRLRSEHGEEVLVSPELTGNEIHVEHEAVGRARSEFEPFAATLRFHLVVPLVSDVGERHHDGGDFAAEAEYGEGIAIEPPDAGYVGRLEAHGHPADRAARGGDAARGKFFDRHRLAILAQIAEVADILRRCFRGRGKPQEPARFRIDALGPAVGCMHHDPCADILEDHPELFFELDVALPLDLALGDIAGDPDKADQASELAPLRCDRQAVPERLAVLAVVEDLALERLPCGERLAYANPRFGIGIGPLQKTAVASYDLGAVIAGQLAERAVGIGDQLLRIGEDHAVAHGLDHLAAKQFFHSQPNSRTRGIAQPRHLRQFTRSDTMRPALVTEAVLQFDHCFAAMDDGAGRAQRRPRAGRIGEGRGYGFETGSDRTACPWRIDSLHDRRSLPGNSSLRHGDPPCRAGRPPPPCGTCLPHKS